MLSSPSSRSHFQSKSKSTRKKLLSLNQSISTCGDDDDEEFEDILNFAPYAKKVEIRKVKEVISIDDSDDESDESMPMSMSMSISKNPPTPPTPQPQPQPQPAKRKNKTKYNTSKKEKKNEVINICDTSSSSSSNSSSSNSSSSNSSSDDSPPPKKKNKVPTTKIPTTKTSVPLTKEEQSNRRLLDKHNKKLAREKSKQEAKKQKDLDKKVQKQMEGKFDVLEIAVVVEKKLSTTPLGNMLVGSLTVNTSNPTPTTTSAQKRESASFKHFVEDDEDEKEVENAIRWKRLGLDEGGADEAMNFGKYADLVCVLFHEPARFLDLLEKEKEKEKDEEDFPKLKKWIDKIVERNKEVEKEEEEDDDEEKEEEEEQQQEEKTRGTKREKTRIIVILPGIKNELNKQWKKNKRSSWSPTTMENLQDALVWMLIQHNVEYELCENEKEAIGFVRGVTVALAEEVYEENLGGACELDCIEKIKVTNKLSNATELQVASDCWYRMLQQILGVSSKKASTVLEYYPTLMSVLEGYEKCEDEDDKKLLLCKCFNKNKVEAVLSEKVYFVLTRSDSGLIL
ncbi:hypothetical protein ScalyP_jg1152 [Parmales sp. scaly parma]|nr:hypothetical protein ScalyP_jg1152 [Parmales sp. scaly parma]